jgi:hypothetical protein
MTRGLAVMFLLAVPALVSAQADSQAETLSWIKKVGGKATQGPNKTVVSVDLHKTKVTDDDLAKLKALTGLKTLDLARAPITDAGMKHLAELKDLESLTLGVQPITDDGIMELKGLTNLKLLRCAATKVTKAGAEALNKHLPRCVIAGP